MMAATAAAAAEPAQNQVMAGRARVGGLSATPVYAASISSRHCRAACSSMLSSLDIGFSHRLCQRPTRVVQVRLDGSGRALHQRGDVLDGEVDEVVQHHGGALSGGKR